MPVFTHRYGVKLDIPEPLNDLQLELFCFGSEDRTNGEMLQKWQHFHNILAMLWGPKSRKHFVLNPWSERQIFEFCQNQYLAILGPASSSKTDTAAVWAVVNWLAAPEITKVLVTSTSLKESQKRIWGSIREYFLAIPGLPGKLVDSRGIIKTVKDDGSLGSDKCGIELISGEKKKEKEAIGKMIGIKNLRLFFIADEMPELSPALLGAFDSNLTVNPVNQFVGIGNFASIYDALGEFAAPLQGYENITTDDVEWDTKHGKCIRFDGLKSPNILSGRDDYPFLFNNKDLAQMRKTMGENSPLFWRMCRSFPCPESVESVIYTEADLIKGAIHEKPIWLGARIPIAFIDPAFTSGGDRSIVCVGHHGITTAGQYIIGIASMEEIKIDVTKEDVPETHQVVFGFIEICKRNHVRPENAGYDSTSGGGIAFGDILKEHWSTRCYGLNFGGRASDEKISYSDERTAAQQYANRVTEIWYGGLAYVQNGQLKGVDSNTAKELKSRKYETKKGGGVRVRAESKKDMKKRTGFSPDKADALLGLLMVARDRLKFLPGEASEVINGQLFDRKPDPNKALSHVYESVDYSQGNLLSYLDHVEI